VQKCFSTCICFVTSAFAPIWLLLEKFGEFFVMLRKLPLLSELEVTSPGIIPLALLLFDVSL